MDLSLLSIYNPWWDLSKNASEIKNKILKNYVQASFKRNYSGFFDFESNGLYILRGPRQIGKSTLLKIAISKLIEKGERRSILYIPLDTVKDFKVLRDILLDFLKFSKSEKKRYIFLDEISMVEDWQKAIKELRDNTDFADDFFVLTGSSAWDIKRTSERLPGRKGNVKSDVLLLPMMFSEFFENIERKKSPKYDVNEIISLGKDDEYELRLISKDTEILFEQYLNSGGIPAVIEAALSGGGDLENHYDTLWDILLGDIERQGLSRSKLLDVLGFTSSRLSQRFSWKSAASEVEIDTKTFQKYINALAYNFMCAVLKFLDKDTLSPRERKQKKVYFYDVFLLYTLRQKLGITNDKASLIENIVGTHLLYRYGKNLENGLTDFLGVGYWYSKEGKEIDFLVNGIPIELKYQNKINADDLRTIKRVFGKGILLSKKTLDLSGEIKIIPVSLFLYMI
ncbi:ATP-binding protein [Kosmotoga olearia]|uniref:AAA ATPase n=1 Tax=Kosmotoga olearia (strain ATCC BAA-1733 / DSM 21960 / TBF 19.5.1) TaxID=521045 RepID=C5CHV1_KOSOT|nr:ATP-binding protein [Kosmotoga olearia]ACR78807.1 AAA ATPase [Kosmotoga olearia TBF 19.5.1]